MPAQSKTKPGTRRLSEVARKLVVPDGITSTGWPAIRDTCTRRLGLGFDEWQAGIGRAILAKRADGKLACMIGGVGMSLPRQVGKTYTVSAIVFGICVNRPGTLVIWSAHHGKTHAETFLAMQAMCDLPKIRPFIKAVYTGSGDEEIRFKNGSRILFGARERGFGRGIPGVDIIVSDEAQIMSDKALDAQLATMNTSQFGLWVGMGTPPRPEDPSEVFSRMRREAWSGELRDAVWIELGAERGCSPTDRGAWAKANPSFPHRTPAESMLRLQRKLTADSFMREGLGVWDEDDTGWLAFSSRNWANASRKPARLKGTPSLALAVTPDLQWASVGAAVLHGDAVWGKLLAHGPGVKWLPEAVKGMQATHRTPLVVDKSGPASSLLEGLRDVGVMLAEVGSSDVADAEGDFVTTVNERGTFRDASSETLRQVLMESARLASWRTRGERRVLDRKAADISAVESLALAVQHARTASYDLMDSIL